MRQQFFLILTAMTLLNTPALGTSDDATAALAVRVVEHLVAGDMSDFEGDFTAKMKAAMTPEVVAQLRDGLLARNGGFERVGAAWFEDKVQGFSRYRVPMFFENGPLDTRVVFDRSGKVAGMFFVPHSERPIESRSPVREIDVIVGDKDSGLPGLLVLPDGDGPFPGVVLVHGSGPSDRDETIGPNKPFRDIAWGLAARGVASLRYDKRSFVRPGDLAALGDELTVQEEVIDDAVVGLALLRERADVDEVFVVGHSLGGTLAPRIAALEPRPAGVVILAGMTLPLPEKMLEQTRYIVSLDGQVSAEERQHVEQIEAAVTAIRKGLADESSVAGFHLGAPLGYYRDLEAVDAPALLARLELPALVLQGGRDYQVTMDDFAVWQRALASNANACLRVFDGLDHLFHEGTGPSRPADYDVARPVAEPVIDCIGVWIRTMVCCKN